MGLIRTWLGGMIPGATAFSVVIIADIKRSCSGYVQTQLRSRGSPHIY